MWEEPAVHRPQTERGKHAPSPPMRDHPAESRTSGPRAVGLASGVWATGLWCSVPSTRMHHSSSMSYQNLGRSRGLRPQLLWDLRGMLVCLWGPEARCEALPQGDAGLRGRCH